MLTDLDAVGNTTKAITKGIAIATAVLAAAALFGSYRDAIATAVADVGAGAGELGLSLDISQPNNLVGLILGAAVVFLFSGLAINAVSRSAGAGGLRGAAAVPRAPRDHGLHREAGVRPRRRHLHQGRPARAGHARPARGPGADRGRVHASASARSVRTSRAPSPPAP